MYNRLAMYYVLLVGVLYETAKGLIKSVHQPEMKTMIL